MSRVVRKETLNKYAGLGQILDLEILNEIVILDRSSLKVQIMCKTPMNI